MNRTAQQLRPWIPRRAVRAGGRLTATFERAGSGRLDERLLTIDRTVNGRFRANWLERLKVRNWPN